MVLVLIRNIDVNAFFPENGKGELDEWINPKEGHKKAV